MQSAAALAATAAGSWICALDLSDRRALLALGRARRYAAGALISSPLDPARGLFMVMEGSVQISIGRWDGAHCLLQIVRAGGSFAETSIVSGARESIAVTARTEALLHFVPRNALRRLLEERPPVLCAFTAALAMRARYQTLLLETLVLLKPLERLQARLAGLAMSTEPDWTGAQSVRLDITQTELAAMCALSRPVVNRILKTLASWNQVELGYGLIAVRRALLEDVRMRRDGARAQRCN